MRTSYSIVWGLILLFNLGCITAAAEEQTHYSRERIDELMAQAGDYYAEGNYQEAIAALTIAADHGNAWGQNNLAWILATVKVPKFLDGERAVHYAGKAVEQEPENPAFVRTLAAAYARNGQFDDAIQTQQKMLKLLEANTAYSDEFKEFLQQDHQEKLALYQKHQAYIDEKEGKE